ncbi:hypothetical protein K493DRAFT_350459 [Basidiobolus meristosporus CBS 931.73]|uniref:Uncharacterized protein n=1 Tax=Basidiobolus meristosporus CBS 931.73 TaxID=1314790 RepID=A0A1Y1YFW4_9FUNG|nr:hypothetical protein K493DRAFT_350459 [Basidiobolus meristosporus CBS 931.73]|eukprot:ORX96875.1 hypothetical protein K493DRAFT_350459 [Basidiobolus meristosporus CBS 931.73]
MLFKSTVVFTGSLAFLLSAEAAPHITQPLVSLGLKLDPLIKGPDAPLLELGQEDPGLLHITPPSLANSPYSIDLPEGLKFNAVNDIVYEGYASLMRDYSVSCQDAIRRIDQEFPNVKNCSDENGLYFSQLDTICSDECLEPTVTASKIIVEACKQEETDGVTDRSYASWSDLATAKAACQPVDYFESKRCLEVVLEANVNRVNLKYKKNAKFREYQEVLCLPCTEEFYLATRDAENVPNLYFSALEESEELFQAFEMYCGYNMPYTPSPTTTQHNATATTTDAVSKHN